MKTSGRFAGKRSLSQKVSPTTPCFVEFFLSLQFKRGPNLRAAKMRKSSSYGNACYAGYCTSQWKPKSPRTRTDGDFDIDL